MLSGFSKWPVTWIYSVICHKIQIGAEVGKLTSLTDYTK